MGLSGELMRTFTERDTRSLFVGDHIIYDTVEEFKKEKGEDYPLKKWGVGLPEDLKAGDWIIADDGYVIQVLRVKNFPNKNGSRTFFVRVPMGTFAIFFTKGRGWIWRQLMAQFGTAQKSSIGHRARMYNVDVLSKVKFATMFLAGVPMIQAVKITFPMAKNLTYNQLLIKAAHLMDDKIVQAELKNQVANFTDDIKQKFDDERIIKELDLLLERSRKGTDAHRCNIQFIMELKGQYISQASKKNGKLTAQEVEYSEVPPSEG